MVGAGSFIEEPRVGFEAACACLSGNQVRPKADGLTLAMWDEAVSRHRSRPGFLSSLWSVRELGCHMVDQATCEHSAIWWLGLISVGS